MPAPGCALEGATNTAAAWLRATLAAGPRSAVDVAAEADAAGITERTCKRARAALGVVATRRGNAWWLAPPSVEAQECQAVIGEADLTPAEQAAVAADQDEPGANEPEPHEVAALAEYIAARGLDAADLPAVARALVDEMRYLGDGPVLVCGDVQWPGTPAPEHAAAADGLGTVANACLRAIARVLEAEAVTDRRKL